MKAREVLQMKGKLITSVDELLTQDQVIFGDKLVPIAWCHGWSLKQTKKNIDRKLLFCVKE